MITIMLVDDQITARAGLRMRLSLEPDIAVVGEASDGYEAIALASRLQPQVVIMDVRMPSMDGLEATKALHTSAPNTAVIITTMYDTAAARAQAEAVGAVAFIPKQCNPEELLAAIRRAAASTEDTDDHSKK